MKITYLNHSGMLIETKDPLHGTAILIDFYTTGMEQALIEKTKSVFANYENCYVLISHAHADHYDKEVFTFKGKNEKTPIYIFSFDVKEKEHPKTTHFLNPYEHYEDANLRIQSYGSTDEGISFYIEVDNKKLFHAGDLNNWHWMAESTQEQTQQYQQHYQEELMRLKKDISSLDVLMFPIDPRLAVEIGLGAKQFCEEISTTYLLPMHFGNAFQEIEKQQLLFVPLTHYVAWKKMGQTIQID